VKRRYFIFGRLKSWYLTVDTRYFYSFTYLTPVTIYFAPPNDPRMHCDPFWEKANWKTKLRLIKMQLRYTWKIQGEPWRFGRRPFVGKLLRRAFVRNVEALLVFFRKLHPYQSTSCYYWHYLHGHRLFRITFMSWPPTAPNICVSHRSNTSSQNWWSFIWMETSQRGDSTRNQVRCYSF
jgi:hypothetical protein